MTVIISSQWGQPDVRLYYFITTTRPHLLLNKGESFVQGTRWFLDGQNWKTLMVRVTLSDPTW